MLPMSPENYNIKFHNICNLASVNCYSITLIGRNLINKKEKKLSLVTCINLIQ